MTFAMQAVMAILKGSVLSNLHKSGYGLGFCPVEAIAD